MQPDENYPVEQVLLDVLGFARLAVKYLGEKSLDEFIASESDRICVIHETLMLGEACRRFSSEFRAMHPELELQRWTRLRNRIIHVYHLVDYLELYRVVKNEMSGFIEAVERLAPKPAAEE